MKRFLLSASVIFSIAAASLITVQPERVAAQSGSRTGIRAATKTFEQKLWDFIVAQKYRNWAPVPGKTDDQYAGSSPHGAFLKMYLNRAAAGRPTELPYGSIIIKENYAPDKKTLMAITVMYKSKGYNPQAGDWYWIKYNPDGTVAKAPPAMNSMPLAGKPMGCIKCHDGSDGGDFAFFNDHLPARPST